MDFPSLNGSCGLCIRGVLLTNIWLPENANPFAPYDGRLGPFFVASLIALVGSSLLIISASYPAFSKGLIFVFTFVLAVEVMYLARLPGVSDWINSASCALLEITEGQC